MSKIKMMVLFFSCMIALVGCSQKAPDSKEKYTCPMHPSIVKENPGQCPICSMDLVRKDVVKKNVKLTSSIGELLQPPNKIVVGSTRMAFPVMQSFEVEIKATGLITSDARSIVAVPVRTAGRIEHIFVHTNFQPVRKGEKILEIYSPDLLNAQQEFLYILRSDPVDSGLLFSAERKLEQAGMNPNQIKNLSTTKVILNSVVVYSPADGYAEAVAAESQTSEIKIRKGQYVQKGDVIFNIVQSGKVRVEIDFPQSSASFLKTNSPIELMLNDGKIIHASVDVIQPFLSSGSPFIKVRSNLSSSVLLPGQLVNAVLRFPSDDALWIPRSARRNLGTMEIVFSKKANVYQVKAIRTGRQTNEWIEVISGVTKSDTLAFEAGMMADGDSFIEVVN